MGLNLCDRCAADCRHERNPNEIVVECGAFKPPMTNSDRIRAMSDEELANTMYSNPIFIVCDAVCKGDCAAIDTLNDTKEDACKRTILEWLRQPSEEGT